MDKRKARKLLKDRRAEVEAQVAGLIEDGRVDNAILNRQQEDTSEDEMRANTIAVHAGIARTLVQLDEADARVADGTFGTCSDCGDKIPDERLEARPFVERCVSCQSAVRR